MNSRWYDGSIGRFVSADVIVPDPTNPQSYNRYSYVLNNAINYTDPTGHDGVWCNDPYEGGANCNPMPASQVSLPMHSDYLLMIAMVNTMRDGIVLETYDHYLPRQLLIHYLQESGAPVYLSESEMVDTGVYLNLIEFVEFNTLLDQITRSGGGTSIIAFEGLAQATTHGTIGNFTAQFEGELTVLVNDVGQRTGWSFDGNVNFYDLWDLDAKPWGERDTYAEVVLRAGNFVLTSGKPFEVRGLHDLPLTQTSLETEASWAGTGVIGTRSRLARGINDLASAMRALLE